MGFDKQFIKINQTNLIDQLIDKLESYFNQIILVTNKPDYYNPNQYTLTSDRFPGKGPLAGLHAGLIESKSNQAFLMACDMPNISLDYLAFQHQQINLNPAIDAVVQADEELRIFPFHGFYSKSLIPLLESTLAQGEVLSFRKFIQNKKLIINSKQTVDSFYPFDDLFVNLNNQDQLNNYLKNIQQQGDKNARKQ